MRPLASRHCVRGSGQAYARARRRCRCACRSTGGLPTMTEPTPTSPKLHFISGLPRSGSTLLAGILRQNPRFHAAMTGPVAGWSTVLLNAMGPQNETAVFLDEERKARAPAGGVRGLLPAAGGQGGGLRHQPGLVRRGCRCCSTLLPGGARALLRARRRLGHGQLRAAGAPERASSRRGCSPRPRSGDGLQPDRGAGASRPGGGLRLVGAEGGLLRRAFAARCCWSSTTSCASGRARRCGWSTSSWARPGTSTISTRSSMTSRSSTPSSARRGCTRVKSKVRVHAAPHRAAARPVREICRRSPSGATPRARPRAGSRRRRRLLRRREVEWD